MCAPPDPRWRSRSPCLTPPPPPRVDFNKDRSVSAKEMQRWIMEKTEEHFQEATKENKNSFHAVDPDGDGERGKRGVVAAWSRS